MSESNWEHLVTLAEASAYKEVKQPSRSYSQKMRDLINDIEVYNVKETDKRSKN